MKNKVLEILDNVSWIQVFFNLLTLIITIEKFQNLTLQRIITFTIILLIANVSVYNLVKNFKKLKNLL